MLGTEQYYGERVPITGFGSLSPVPERAIDGV